MKSVRERFEEIWPVPRSIYWDDAAGVYLPHRYHDASVSVCAEYAARLDTFTRCQETTDVYVSLVDELVSELDHVLVDAYHWTPPRTQEILDRAKQIMEQKK